jgi:Flp pilus assembly CpaE family ATPase
MDPWFGDVAGALGVPFDPPPRTLSDLRAVAPDISGAHARDVFWRHDDGFDVLLAPDKEAGPDIDLVYRSAVRAIAGTCDVAVLHLPRTLDGIARAGFDLADRIVVVTTLDVLGFRAAKQVIDTIGDVARVEIVVNRAVRSDIVPADVERVFGKPALAVIPADRRVGKAQDRGKLLAPKGPAPRAIARLASSLLGGRR